MNIYTPLLSGGEKAHPDRSWMEIAARQVDTLRCGAVQITVHDSRVVQVERTEKQRLVQAQKPLTELINSLPCRPTGEEKSGPE